MGRYSASLASEKGCQRTYDKKKKIKSCRLLNFISLVTIKVLEKHSVRKSTFSIFTLVVLERLLGRMSAGTRKRED